MTCLAPNTKGDGTGCDNMTCIIVKPNAGKSTLDLNESKTSVDQISCDTIASDTLPGDVPSSSDKKTDAAVTTANDEKSVNENTGEDHDTSENEAAPKGQKRIADHTETDEVTIKRQKTEELDLNNSSSVESLAENS